MAVKTISRPCKVCQHPRPFQKEGVNHVLHLLLSCVTFGFWLLIWIVLIFANAFKPYRCTFCGTAA